MARKEIGRIGQKRFEGTFYEEFLPELRGKRGMDTYREMAEMTIQSGPSFLLSKCLSDKPHGQWSLRETHRRTKKQRNL